MDNFLWYKQYCKMFFSVIFCLMIATSVVRATLDPAGTLCKQKRCLTTEYCSDFDHQCYPCSRICEPGRNNEAAKCVKDCQEYLHDQRYVLRKEVGVDLSDEVKRLKNLVTVSLTLTCISLLGVIFLLAWRSSWIKHLRKMVQVGWIRKKWIKKATNNNRVQDDAEVGATAGAVKQNGLKLAMPTISATVVEPRNNDQVGDGTPNTTSTPLSRRHPSEDATLDYAYDNPAMTPSPEVVQPRTKRESSF